jgi:hypothetical protein
MISRALNSDNDLQLVGGQIHRVSDGPEVLQAVRSRLLFYRGEHFMDTTVGVPYFQQILVKPANLPLFESLLKSEILGTVGVEELLSFSVDFNKLTRRSSVSFSARTTFGEIVNSEVFLNV